MVGLKKQFYRIEGFFLAFHDISPFWFVEFIQIRIHGNPYLLKPEVTGAIETQLH